jgi:hypothetical protein
MEPSIREQINELAAKYYKLYKIEEGSLQDLIEDALNAVLEIKTGNSEDFQPSPFQNDLMQLFKNAIKYFNNKT